MINRFSPSRRNVIPLKIPGGPGEVEPNATIGEIKSMFHKSHPQWYPARQSIRLDPKGKSLKDEDVLQHLPVGTTATFYFRDLGAQISWVTVSSKNTISFKSSDMFKDTSMQVGSGTSILRVPTVKERCLWLKEKSL
ncbi:hypothetical protein ATANTOWER_020682 [Ataeniobius toweri]|uniref:TECR-like N-terminal domain-containing protein n=1 Tax=Ataeniobius toweri TaxID=208326 RepID=A0ABU7CHW3_9TELE|nr:hypothetical protein [Ataeniobius toweri]